MASRNLSDADLMPYTCTHDHPTDPYEDRETADDPEPILLDAEVDDRMEDTKWRSEENGRCSDLKTGMDLDDLDPSAPDRAKVRCTLSKTAASLALVRPLRRN